VRQTTQTAGTSHKAKWPAVYKLSTTHHSGGSKIVADPKQWRIHRWEYCECIPPPAWFKIAHSAKLQGNTHNTILYFESWFFLIKDSAFLFKSDFFSYFSLFMLHKLIRTCHKQLKCRTVWLAVANLLTLLWRVSMLTCNIDTGILSVRYLLFFSLSRSGIVSKRLDISSLHCSQSA